MSWSGAFGIMSALLSKDKDICSLQKEALNLHDTISNTAGVCAGRDQKLKDSYNKTVNGIVVEGLRSQRDGKTVLKEVRKLGKPPWRPWKLKKVNYTVHSI